MRCLALELGLWLGLTLCIRVAYCDVITLKENDFEGSLCYLRNSTRGQCRKSCSGLEFSEYKDQVCNPGKSPTLYCCSDWSTAQLYPNIHEACLDRLLAENMYSTLIRTFENKTRRLGEIDRVYDSRAQAIGVDCIKMALEIEEDERPFFLDSCVKRWSVRDPKIGISLQLRNVRYPSIAGIGVSSDDNQNIHWICTGHFVTSAAVLTSAQCIVGKELEELPNVVRHGRDDLNHFTFEETGVAGSSTYDVVNIVVHEEYNEETGHADIAILKVLRDVWSESKIHLNPLPACLWTRKEVPSKNLQFVGYTTTLHEGNAIPQLKALCRIDGAISPGTTSCYACGLRDKTEVVGTILYNEKLQQDISYLLAIGTSNTPCRGAQGPAKFTYVYPYLEWIENVISR